MAVQSGLSDAVISSMKAPPKVIHLKGEPKGLVLEVRPNGVKVWLWRGRRPDGVAAKVTLGTYSATFGVAEANSRAQAINDGKKRCVWLPHEEALGVQTIAMDARANATLSNQTLDAFWTEYYKPRFVEKLKGKAETARLYERRIRPYIGDRLLLDLDHEALAATVAKCARTAPVSANRVAGLLRAIFKRALTGDLRSLTGLRDNAAASLLKPTGANERERILDRDELGVVLATIEARAAKTAGATAIYARGLKLMVATGCHREEAFAATWGHFDLEAGEWLQTHGAKAGHANRLVLPPETVVWLKGLKATGAKVEEFVFPAGPDKSETKFFSFSKAHADLIWDANKRAGPIGVSVARWSRHDLRRTVVTKLRDILSPGGLDPEVSDAVVSAEALLIWRDYLADALAAYEVRVNEKRAAGSVG
ncbi:integrase family protein [Sphingomonas sp. BIUV-7]|uniref:Integrase family protein n=1 Tax=Sphingomonas natans TaxID=3063330 RepID=A0ABT8YD50_9SPHN|nr:integrase family protein [Sphingomonas sp. BIUV-7]MDO6416268.1 integrase family protein [Sphingomonas sp. BIUV-7]